ncbi:Fe-S oxidoreductase [Candidatus Magnetobacterium bavaricum]|uniref:Fe-S oxidoreductase n=1 Tax=Candidatus Magnetobacterium bavaricum TaxID=29290 RepID=A0A0F3GK59_9BACT|nr:Fe-S oxidoreductase [Candidatus Magnetobacterium bavaricum]
MSKWKDVLIMRILCLNPPFKTEHGRFSRTSRSPAITKSGTIYYPIWLCYVVGVLEDDGHEVKIIDSCAYSYDMTVTISKIKEFKPEISVLDTSTPSIYSDIKAGEEIKKLFPDSFVILMGTHTTALPEETLNISNYIDGIAIGEADYIVKSLAKTLSRADMNRLQSDISYRNEVLSKIDGLAYCCGGTIIKNKKMDLIDDIDKLPFVSKVYKKHIDTKKYFFAASDYPEIQIMTSRGCIAQCTFCVYPQTVHGLKYRTRSARNIADEFEWIVKNMPEIREIGIEDDTFTGNQKKGN